MKFEIGLRFPDDTWNSFEEVRKDLLQAIEALEELRGGERDGALDFVSAKIGAAHTTDAGHRGISFVVAVEMKGAAHG